MKIALMTGVVAALILVGCAQTKAASSVGMGNPASIYCGKVGGKLRIDKTPRGEVGVCVLPDGSEMDEWELFRRDHPSN
jgi:putative hemolysin